MMQSGKATASPPQRTTTVLYSLGLKFIEQVVMVLQENLQSLLCGCFGTARSSQTAFTLFVPEEEAAQEDKEKEGKRERSKRATVVSCEWTSSCLAAKDFAWPSAAAWRRSACNTSSRCIVFESRFLESSTELYHILIIFICYVVSGSIRSGPRSLGRAILSQFPLMLHARAEIRDLGRWSKTGCIESRSSSSS
jgi:hypothetical protein